MDVGLEVDVALRVPREPHPSAAGCCGGHRFGMPRCAEIKI